MLDSRSRHQSICISQNIGVLAWISENTYTKHVGHASNISVTSVESEKNLPWFSSTKQIAVALVSSKLDYHKSLFHNLSENDITRTVENCLAGVVTKFSRFSRSVLILKQLHWFPVKFRIYFNICTIIFRALKDNRPAYLADLLVPPKC